MTQYEYIEELSRYLHEKYDFTISLNENKRWYKGYCISFNGIERNYFDVENPEWKEHIFQVVNSYMREKKLI